jgi:hypothetical protein
MLYSSVHEGKEIVCVSGVEILKNIKRRTEIDIFFLETN